MCIFLTKKKLSYLCFNAKMKWIIQKSENLDCEEPRLPLASRFSCVVEHFQAFHCCFLKKKLFLGMRFGTKNTWRPYIVHFCRLLRLIKLEIIIMHHKTRFFLPHPDTSWEALLPLISLNCAESSRPNMKPRSNWVLQTRWEVDLWPVPPDPTGKAAVENPIIPNGIVTASQDRLPVETLAHQQPGWEEACPHTWLLELS